MKNILFTLLFICGFAGVSAAQQKFSTTDFNSKIGKTGTLCDTIYSLKIVNDNPHPAQYGWRISKPEVHLAAIKGNKKSPLDWAKQHEGQATLCDRRFRTVQRSPRKLK